MTYRVPLPAGLTRSELDVLDPYETMIQRYLRREGLGAYEPETMATVLALVEMADEPCVLDVGSNIGLYSSMCAALRPGAPIVAFEPMPRIAEIARAIAAKNDLQVDVVTSAVGDTSGEATLYLSEVSDASNSLVSGFKPSSQTIDVPIVRLDDVVDARGLVPTLVKVDVETAEPAVIRGAIETIRRHRPFVVIEVLRRRGDDHGTAIEEAFDVEGYHRYALSRTPEWTSRPAVRGSGTAERDWLLSPYELPVDFGQRWSRWFERLAACGPERNSAPPALSAVRLAYRRGGLGEVVRTGRRFAKRAGGSPVDAADDPSELKSIIRRVAERVTEIALFRNPGSTASWAYSSHGPGGLRDRSARAVLGSLPVSAADRTASVSALEESFFRLCADRDIDLFVEVGAKDARASRRAVMEFGVDAIAFEANPFTFRRFREDVEAAGVDYRHVALSDHDGPVTFHVRRTEAGRPRADGQGSLLVRSDYSPGHEEVVVDGQRLDVAVQAADHPGRRSAMWIDVEGATASVLRGASGVLASVEAMFIEVETEPTWDGQEYVDSDVIAHLAEFGLHPVGRDLQSRRQFNVVFARR